MEAARTVLVRHTVAVAARTAAGGDPRALCGEVAADGLVGAAVVRCGAGDVSFFTYRSVGHDALECCTHSLVNCTRGGRSIERGVPAPLTAALGTGLGP